MCCISVVTAVVYRYLKLVFVGVCVCVCLFEKYSNKLLTNVFVFIHIRYNISINGMCFMDFAVDSDVADEHRRIRVEVTPDARVLREDEVQHASQRQQDQTHRLHGQYMCGIPLHMVQWVVGSILHGGLIELILVPASRPASALTIWVVLYHMSNAT